MKKILYSLTCILLLQACAEKQNKAGKPIVMGDPSMIVTETDSAYLQNFTEDITPQHKKGEGAITKMMVQVDSANAAKQLNEENHQAAPLAGFTIQFNECKVVFDDLSAHAININQDERKANSVSYVIDRGNILAMKLEVEGLENTTVEQRIHTKLQIEHQNQTYIIQDLNKYISAWYNLVGKDQMFISVGSNSLQFFPFNAAALKNGFDRELRKKKQSRAVIESGLKAIEQVHSYMDAPCAVQIVGAQWRIKGTYQGKKIQKLIQFDIPLN